MVEIIEFIKEFDLHTIITVAVFTWFFKSNIDKQFKKVKGDLKLIDSRLTRLEGAIHQRVYWESRKIGAEHKHEVD